MPYVADSDQELEKEDKLTVNSNRNRFLDTQGAYYTFVNDLIKRIALL